MVRLTTSILGITTEALYDYSLGIIYLFQDGGACTMQPATVMAPGIDPKTGHFSLATLFQLDKQYNYIGEVYFVSITIREYISLMCSLEYLTETQNWFYG